MAKKGKAKISKVKRNNQTTNKMKKKGLLRLQRHKSKPQKQRQPVKEAIEYSSDSDKESGDEWKDMLDEEEQQYIVSRLSKQPGLLSNVPENEPAQHHNPKKRKRQEKPPKPAKVGSDSGAESYEGSDSEVEEKYEQEQSERPVKKMRSLLPIKTKEGLQERSVECDDTESESDSEETKKKEKSPEPDEEVSESDSGLEAAEVQEEGQKRDGVVTAVELMAARRDRLKHEKLRIGALCSSLLEEPEKKLKNLYAILYLMEEKLKDGALNLHSVRKLATLSTFEVFKDILPDYQIRHQDYSNVKLKKDTLSLYKYEKELLEFYKRYLQRLEKAAMVLRKKKGDTRKLDPPTQELAFVSLRCLSGLLSARPHFNYATNIAQSVVPFLDSGHEQARATVTEACSEVFKEDNKGDITLVIVRLINQLVKRKGERLHPASLDCLLTLRIRDVDLDEEMEIQNKKKQEEKHKKRIVNLSKKEKKRAKKLKEVERELLETQAHESDAARKKQLTEVTKTVFHIYFRLLKTAPRSKLLATALTGLAKFTHVINLDYYSDLVAILGRLISDELVGARERLLCARTALAVLSGAGDALNVDPATFHNYLYVSALNVHAGHTHEDSKIVLESVQQVIARARRVSANVLQALAKRLATMATNTQHNAAIACLTLLYQLVQQSKPVSSLLELDSEVAGSGSYAALAASAEQCGAHAARLHELVTLRRHYHPGVRQVAQALAHNPVTLPKEFHKMTAGRIFDEYDGSKMTFKPAIKHTANKT